MATDSLSARDRLGKSNTGRSLFLLFAPRFGWSRLLMLKKTMGKGQSERTKVKAHFLLHPPLCWRLAFIQRHPFSVVLCCLEYVVVCAKLIQQNCFELNFRSRLEAGLCQSFILISMNFGGALWWMTALIWFMRRLKTTTATLKKNEFFGGLCFQRHSAYTSSSSGV